MSSYNLILNTLRNEGISEENRVKILQLLIEESPEYQDIYNRLKQYVKLNIPELKNLTETSIAATYLKVIGFTFYEFIILSIRSLERNIYVETADEEYLLRYGKEFGIKRKKRHQFNATIRVGSIDKPISRFILPQESIIQILGDKSTRFLYTKEEIEINNQTQVDINGYYTEKVNVYSKWMNAFDQTKDSFMIEYTGYDIAYDMEIQEDFQKEESFEEYRSRILSISQGMPSYSQMAIRTKIQNFSYIKKVYIDEIGTTGKVKLWVEFLPHINIEENKIKLEKELEEQFSLLESEVHPITYEPINMVFFIIASQDINQTDFTENFKKDVSKFFFHYKVENQKINLKVLFKYAYQNKEIYDIQIQNPANTMLYTSIEKRYILNEMEIQWSIR